MATDTEVRPGEAGAEKDDYSPDDEAAAAAFNALDEQQRDDLVSAADAAGQTLEEYASSQGKTVEQLARERAENGDPPEEVPPMQMAIPGTRDRISDKAGGTRPTTSEARFLGASIPIDGQYDGEEYLIVQLRVKVSEVDFVYTTDDWGKTKAVIRRHKLRAIAVEGVEPVA